MSLSIQQGRIIFAMKAGPSSTEIFLPSQRSRYGDGEFHIVAVETDGNNVLMSVDDTDRTTIPLTGVYGGSSRIYVGGLPKVGMKSKGEVKWGQMRSMFSVIGCDLTSNYIKR